MDVRTLCVVFTLASFHMYLHKWLIYTMSKFVGWIIDLFDGDAGSAVPQWEAGDGVVLQERWVTLAAGMWPPEPTTSMTTPTRGWKLADERVPLLVAVFSGAALVACLLCGLVLCKCCVMPRRVKHKHDCELADSVAAMAATPGSVEPAFYKKAETT